jgi:uncharacterized protein (DUF2236 family)
MLTLGPKRCIVLCCAALRCAVMSANEQKDTVFQAIKSGAEEYLVKPVTKKEVQNIWQYVWKRLQAQQEVPQQQLQQAAILAAQAQQVGAAAGCNAAAIATPADVVTPDSANWQVFDVGCCILLMWCCIPHVGLESTHPQAQQSQVCNNRHRCAMVDGMHSHHPRHRVCIHISAIY